MLGVLVVSFLPPGTKSVVLPFGPLHSLDGRTFEMPGRTLVVEWPAFLRVGEAGQVRLEITAGEQPAGLKVTAGGRLDLPALAGQPDESGGVLLAGQPLRFTWDVKTSAAGSQQGLLWLTIWVEGQDLPGEEIAVMARPVDIPVRNPLGWRIAAGAGLLLAAAGALRLRLS